MKNTKESLMEQAQVFASAWSLIGGPFDCGDGLDNAEQARTELAEAVDAIVRQRDELLGAIKEARECIATDRDSLYETHRNPSTNTVDDAFGLDGLADYDAVLDWIDAVVSKVEAA